MKILEVYILKRVFQMFLTALLPVLGIVWTTQVLVRINLVTDTGQSIGAFIKLATLILPTIIPIVLPFALVIGITQTLSTMNNDSELTVIDAAGSSRSVIVRPIILLSVVLSLFSFGVDNFVEPQVRQAARQMIASAYADLLSSIVEEKNFRKLQDGVYVQVSARGKGRSLEGLFVADTRDPATEMIYYSRRGAIDETGTSLIMQDGEVHRKAANGNVSVIRFDSYTFDLSDLSAQKGKAKLSANDRDLAFLLNPDPEDPYYKDDPAEFRAELHSRFTEWLFPLAFGLISLTAAGGARSHRQAQVHPMVTAMSLSFTVRWACFYAANSVGQSEGFILMMYAVPLVTILVCIYLLRREKRFACTVRFAAWLQGLVQQFQQRFARSGDAGAVQ